MNTIIHCTACNAELEIENYLSMMVVSHRSAMFTVKCPECGTVVPSFRLIPDSLRPQVEKAALELHAGMGRGE